MSYAHVNLYVGKYDIPKDGHIALNKAGVRIRHGVEDAWGWTQTSEGKPWLIVDDGGFFPVMVRLTAQDIKELKKLFG